jgi:hypothetical protein
LEFIGGDKRPPNSEKLEEEDAVQMIISSDTYYTSILLTLVLT